MAVELMLGSHPGALAKLKDISMLPPASRKAAMRFRDTDGNSHMHNLLGAQKPDEDYKVVRCVPQCESTVARKSSL